MELKEYNKENIIQRIEVLEQNTKITYAEIQKLKQELNIIENNRLNNNYKKQGVVVNNVEDTINKYKVKTNQRSTEQVIGKVAMGIGASILVFIAMIMFATLIIPMFNNTLKMISMYSISIILIIVGELIYRKGKNSYVILSACGVGSLFISLITTCVYFHAINTTILYLLLFLWVFGIAFYLSRNRSLIFVIIGQIGIVISVFIARYNSHLTIMDNILLLSFIIITEAIFFIRFFNKSFNLNLANCSGLLVSFWLLTIIIQYNTSDFGIFSINTFTEYISTFSGLIIIFGSSIYLNYIVKEYKQYIMTRIFNIISLIASCSIIYNTFIQPSSSYSWIIILPIICYIGIMFWFNKKYDDMSAIYVINSIYITTIFVCLSISSEIIYLRILCPLYCALTIFGLYKKEKFYIFSSFSCIGIIILLYLKSNLVWINSDIDKSIFIFYLCLILVLSLIQMIIILKYNQEILPYEISSYISSSILILTILDGFNIESIIISTIFLVIAIISIILGFLFNKKSTRLYGLILSLCSIAKLVLIDISYDNTLMRACSFLLCGLLCFGISIIYNRAEKKIKKDIE